MSEIKKLAGQTVWYGLSSVGARMLNYLLTPLLTYLMSDYQGVADYGDYNLLYACIAFANIIFTYGFETGYFRFSNRSDVNQNTLFQTTFGSLLLTSTILFIGIGFFHKDINHFLELADHPEYILWALGIIVLDTIAVIPFAKLRQNNQPRRYAFIKLSGIIVNILFVILFLALLPKYYNKSPDAWGANWFIAQNKVGLLLLANIIMNVFVVAMLFPQWKSFRFKMDIALWKKVFKYASPMIIIGLAGMINEVVDRIMLAKLLPFDTETNKVMVGIYGANYKLAIFITLFIQAFKMAAEPFFFKQAADKNAPALYAKVMQWFVWTMCIAFLITMLFIDIWQYLLGGEIYRKGLHIVPILLLANIFLGIYYNLSVWYKITDKMIAGIWITLVGALITIIGNLILIPQEGIIGAARVTLICYLSMVAMSYYMGQKHFPVPYPIKKIGFYLLVMIVLTILHQLFSVFVNLGSWNLLTRLALGGIGLFLFIIITIRQEKEMLQKIPYLNKFFK